MTFDATVRERKPRRRDGTSRRRPRAGYSTVTVLARLRGWSTFSPRLRAMR
jgi:hypothetical protein